MTFDIAWVAGFPSPGPTPRGPDGPTLPVLGAATEGNGLL